MLRAGTRWPNDTSWGGGRGEKSSRIATNSNLPIATKPNPGRGGFKTAHLRAFRSGISCELQLKGAPLAYLQNQLGHRDQSITLEHYTHLMPELTGSLTKQFFAYLGSTAASQPPPPGNSDENR